jgi:glycosyltransferase involved in cell wall biosynthesis
VRSDSFAGVERYIRLVAPRQAARGCDVTVVGGDQVQMGRVPGAVRWKPGSTTLEVAAHIARLGHVDVVHAHMTAAEVAAVVTKPIHRARLVCTLHFASPRGSSSAAGRLLSPLGGLMDEQIAISRFVSTRVPSTRVLLNGVEVAEPGQLTRERLVMVMQRLEAEKHTEIALQAWASSNLRENGWRLAIAGRGSKLDELRLLAREIGVAESVDWLGFLDDPAGLLARVSVLLAPAPEEPFGFTVVEAMARATPVIAADGGAHRETLGDDAWLFPPGDACACARLLDELASRDLTAYGSGLRTRQHELFDVESHADRLVEIYLATKR